MVSYCVFEKCLWGKGVAVGTPRLFLGQITGKFHVRTVGGFTFAKNTGPIHVMDMSSYDAALAATKSKGWIR